MKRGSPWLHHTVVRGKPICLSGIPLPLHQATNLGFSPLRDQAGAKETGQVQQPILRRSTCQLVVHYPELPLMQQDQYLGGCA